MPTHFIFFDNNENILEFICRYDRNIKAVDFFDGRQVINISEAAVACDSISEMMADLHQKFSLQPYEKQPPLDNFAAIGDVCGLFILSASGRSWFPTKVAAKHFPICVRFGERGYDYEFRKD